MADKRTVMTDALETLGTIITEREKRDAIHLAVLPIEAGEQLYPGRDVGIGADGKAYFKVDKLVGIVDPFVPGGVNKGQWFWLVIYPRKITSLRHVWVHPDIDDVPDMTSDRARSEAWLRNFCDTADCPNYETVIGRIISGSHASGWSEDYFHFDGQDAHSEIPPEFWDHAEIVTGKKIAERPVSFSCSC